MRAPFQTSPPIGNPATLMRQATTSRIGAQLQQPPGLLGPPLQQPGARPPMQPPWSGVPPTNPPAPMGTVPPTGSRTQPWITYPSLMRSAGRTDGAGILGSSPNDVQDPSGMVGSAGDPRPGTGQESVPGRLLRTVPLPYGANLIPQIYHSIARRNRYNQARGNMLSNPPTLPTDSSPADPGTLDPGGADYHQYEHGGGTRLPFDPSDSNNPFDNPQDQQHMTPEERMAAILRDAGVDPNGVGEPNPSGINENDGIPTLDPVIVNGQPVNQPGGSTNTGGLLSGWDHTGGGVHYDYTRGAYVPNDNATGAQFDNHAANLLLMDNAMQSGEPNTLQDYNGPNPDFSQISPEEQDAGNTAWEQQNQGFNPQQAMLNATWQWLNPGQGMTPPPGWRPPGSGAHG